MERITFGQMSPEVKKAWMVRECVAALEWEDSNGVAIRNQTIWNEIRTNYLGHLDDNYAIRESLAAEIVEKAMEIHYGHRCEHCYVRLAESRCLEPDNLSPRFCLECTVYRGPWHAIVTSNTRNKPIHIHIAKDHKSRQYLEVLCVSCDKILNIGKRFPDSEFPRLVCLRCGSSVELHATFDEHT